MNEEDHQPKFQRFVRDMLIAMGVFAAVLLVILAFIEKTPIQVEWVRGFFNLMCVCAGGTLTFYGALEGLRAHKERERRDRLVKIKRDAYMGLAKAFSKMSWAMSTYWGEKDPTRDPEMADTNFEILSVHLVGSIGNIQDLANALDHYNKAIQDGRADRLEIDKIQAEISVLAKRKSLFEDRYLSVILSNPPAKDEDARKKQTEELAHYLKSADITASDLRTAFQSLNAARQKLYQFIEPRRLHFLWLASKLVPRARIESELEEDFDPTRYAQIYEGFEMKPQDKKPQA